MENELNADLDPNINNAKHTSCFIKSKTEPIVHSSGILALLQLSNKLILSSSYDKQICVHYPSSCQMIRQLKETKYGAKCLLQLKDTRVIGGSYSFISLWDFPSLEHIKDIKAHNDWIQCIIQLQNNCLCTSSSDLNIHIWDINTFTITHTIIGHDRVINTIIELSDGRFASGSSDNTLNVWATHNDTSELLATFRDKYCWFTPMILLQDGRIASGGWDGQIKFYDMTAYKLNEHILEHESVITALYQLKSGLMISTCKYNLIKVWNIGNYQCLLLIEESNSIGVIIELNQGGILLGKSNKLTLWE